MAPIKKKKVEHWFSCYIHISEL